MKYHREQKLILLDTTYKPVSNAVVKDFDADTEKYLVQYQLNPQSQTQELWVAPERLWLLTDAAGLQGKTGLFPQ